MTENPSPERGWKNIRREKARENFSGKRDGIFNFSESKPCNILERRIEDAAERFFAIESDMGGEDDIIAAEEIVVLFDLPGLGRAAIFVQALIFFFDMLLSFEDIEAGAG